MFLGTAEIEMTGNQNTLKLSLQTWTMTKRKGLKINNKDVTFKLDTECNIMSSDIFNSLRQREVEEVHLQTAYLFWSPDVTIES